MENRGRQSPSTAEQNTCTAVVLCQAPEPAYLKYLRERWEEDYSKISVKRRGSGEGSGGDEEEEVNPLLLDPVQWKDQDHYVILGLGKLRYKATMQDIKKAYRQKVLTHHPDKQTEEQQKDGDDYFKCIKIANDILSNAKKRRSYDSVDPTFDDSTPTISANSRDHFYATFGPVFTENSRWSLRQPVPQLGDENSSIEEVDAFYSFWYNFDSWREFSYLDEESSEKGECREERRWIEKQNKAARQKKKKEEMARLRTLVDNAYACDPRVKRFKEEEKAIKEAKKKAKAEAVKKEAAQREDEERRRREELRLQQEREENEAKVKAAQAKKEKEAARKAIRKERKNFRAACKEYNYFAHDDSDLVTKMQDLDRLCTCLSLESLQHLNQQFLKVTAAEAQSLFEQQVSELDRQEQEKSSEMLKAASVSSESSSSAAALSKWSSDEMNLLVKAVNLYPAGTVKRWEAIAKFINTHSPEGSEEKDAKMVISKVKALQKLESDQKEALNKQAFARFEQHHQTRPKRKDQAEESIPSQRYDGPRPWTAEEQKLLEKALRSNPASLGAERWDRVADMVGSRTKEECVARFKELVARVKAKKQTTT